MIQTVVPPKEVIHHERVISPGRAIDYCLSSATCERRTRPPNSMLPRCLLSYAPLVSNCKRRMPSCNKSASCLSATPISIRSPTWATATDSTVTSNNSGAKATPRPAPILTSTISSIATIGVGHAEGNRYISICRRASPKPSMMLLFRIGGDEFVLISPSANEIEFEQRLEQVRTRLIEASSGRQGAHHRQL